MIVTCESCGTSFQLDDSRVPVRGIRVRCSRCKKAFFLQHPSASKSDAVHDVAAQAAADAGRNADSIAIATTNERPLPESDADSSALLEHLSRQREQGVSHFVMDFGNPADTEPILRFKEQVIEKMR